MKKSPISLLMTCTAAVLIMFTACNKTNDQQPDNATVSDDQSQFSAEVDAITNEANDLLGEYSSAFNRNTSSSVCDATVALNTSGENKTLTITYN